MVEVRDCCNREQLLARFSGLRAQIQLAQIHSLLDWALCVFLGQISFTLPCPLITDESHLWPSPWKFSIQGQSLNYHLSLLPSLCFSVQDRKPWASYVRGRHCASPAWSVISYMQLWWVNFQFSVEIFIGYWVPLLSLENTSNIKNPANLTHPIWPAGLFVHSGMVVIIIHGFLLLCSMWKRLFSGGRKSNPTSLGHCSLQGHSVVSMTKEFHECEKQA